MRLTDPLPLAGRTAPSRVVFGPHETNLGHRREFSSRHVAYYARRAAGGAGVVVTETASVHGSDWPYERAPLAADCGPGWAATVAACRPAGALVLAGLGHTGAQGSSAWSQAALWAPSRVPDVAVREVPMEMEDAELTALVSGFAAATRTAVTAGVDGVEVDAGPGALLRQFLSGLTNTRTDAHGTDRLRLLREVLEAVRAELGTDLVLALRLSCDELAPWAGITPGEAAGHVAELAGVVDLLTVVRGSGLAAAAYRPDGHTPAGFNRGLAGAMRAAARGRAAVVLQGSVVDPAQAQQALDDGTADAVEMTRAQIADAGLVARVRAGTPSRVRPCVLCNQACQVRDVRNPLVSCVVDPRSGHETEDPDPGARDDVAGEGREVLVLGAGPAGLEAARVLAAHGHAVRVVHRGPRPGGLLAVVAAVPGRARFAAFADWLVAECTRLGVRFEAAGAGAAEPAGADAVVLATGGGPGHRGFEAGDGVRVCSAEELLTGGGPEGLPPGPVLVHDPVGGSLGVGVAELLAAAGRPVTIVTPDRVVGARLARTGDLAPANVRLQRAGVQRETTTVLRAVGGGRAVLADRVTGRPREVACTVVVDCGHRLPGGTPARLPDGVPVVRAGDAVAPRTVLEAVLEGRRAALALHAGTGVDRCPVPA
ncbi:mycofactocin system FadH/OYE family oxidoreductase 1 [Modestobacter sp. URMC 112]